MPSGQLGSQRDLGASTDYVQLEHSPAALAYVIGTPARAGYLANRRT